MILRLVHMLARSCVLALMTVVLVSLNGCSVHQAGATFSQPQVYVAKNAVHKKANQAFSKTFNGPKIEQLAHQRLREQHSKWAGTPYRFGGNSSSGIDCSALMMNVFKAAFNESLPRTTVQQVKVGQSVSKKELKVGDLVFFKLGRNQRHVGVFMGQSTFLHASVSNGVTYSRLDDPYWQMRYWQSRRIL